MSEQQCYNLVKASQLPDGNIEIIRRFYEGRVALPMFSKIIADPKWNVLAYVDVKMIPPQRHINSFYSMIRSYNLSSKNDRWFGIEEFHPEIIGNFTYKVISDPVRDNCTDHIQWVYNHSRRMYDLYLFGMAGEGTCTHMSYSQPKHWYKVEAGQITTNVRPTLASSENYTYKYNTCPAEPSDFVIKCVNWAKENLKVKQK